MGIILFIFLPKEARQERPDNYFKSTLSAFKMVFKNPQSILCGFIAALIFIPTNLLDMILGVRFLQERYGFDYGTAVMRTAAVPFGWLLVKESAGSGQFIMKDYRVTFEPLIIGVGLAIFLTFFLKETGHTIMKKQ